MTGAHHDHAAIDHNRAFAVGVALNVLFVAVEAVFGILAGSLALLADAGHNLSDVLSLLLAWGASYLARRPPTHRRTYGLRRSTILASLLNAVILLVAVGAIGWEAVRRLGDPAPVASGTMMAVAGVGVAVNTATALLFASGRHHDLNLKGAYLHMAADAAISAGVVAAGLAIWLTQATWIDPALSLVIVLAIAIGTWGLFRDSVNLALDAVPAGIDPQGIRAWLRELDGVVAVHDLHIWAMSTTETALTAHLVMPEAASGDEFLCRVARELRDRFHIAHATIQIERGDMAHPCQLASDDHV
ncbi:MAG TPA: cation diffusion facilitator family transporter [Planctomycetaceae bacterium]|nr:cation diffusion facilitator family transporter [Planctomycetaceae bacterium]